MSHTGTNTINDAQHTALGRGHLTYKSSDLLAGCANVALLLECGGAWATENAVACVDPHTTLLAPVALASVPTSAIPLARHVLASSSKNMHVTSSNTT